MNCNQIENDQVQAVVSQAEGGLLELQESQLAIVGGGCGEVIVG